MYTMIETAMCRRYAEQVWQDDEREAFITWLAADPLVGDVIPVYYNTLDDGQVWLLIVYSKSKFDNLPASLLRQLREELDHG